MLPSGEGPVVWSLNFSDPHALSRGSVEPLHVRRWKGTRSNAYVESKGMGVRQSKREYSQQPRSAHLRGLGWWMELSGREGASNCVLRDRRGIERIC